MLLPAWKVGAALAHGNTVVWKCSELVPFSAIRLAAAFAAAGLPDGVLNLLPGGAYVGEAIVDHPARAAVSFTGSTAVGTAIARRLGGRGARVQLELGGRNPAIVLADADPAFAADLVTNGAVSGSGQKCAAIALAIVEKPIYDDVRAALAERFASLVVGHGLDETTDVGPLVSEPARERFHAAVDEAVGQGTEVLSGQLAPPPRDGYYVAPTLLHRLPAGSSLLRREVFGPLLTLVPAADADEAVRIANDSEYGLNAAIITSDIGRALDLADRLEAGMVHVNAVCGFLPHIPFGGIKASGFGPLEQGDTTAEFFTHTRVLHLHPHQRRHPHQRLHVSGAAAR
jgi:acyl-CoA reductase-like NAD-dependent aldehyde dehydrogenase